MLLENTVVDINKLGDVLEARQSKSLKSDDNKDDSFKFHRELTLSEKSTINNMIDSKLQHLKETLAFRLFRDLAIDSIPIDEDAKESHMNELSMIYESKFDSIGGYTRLKELSKTENYIGRILESIDFIVESKRKKCEEGEEPELTKKDKDKVKELKTDNSEISNIVKDKVINVIKKEREEYKKEKEDIETLKDELKDNFPNDSEEKLEERYLRAISDRGTLRENTLYSSLMSKYTKIVESCNDSINMDEVMATTITEYTILEFFHTVGLKEFTRLEVKNMIDINSSPFK